MKKIIAMVLVVLVILSMSVSLAACGNMSLGMGNFTFEKVHVDTYHYNGCFTVEKWYDNSTGIEVKTKEVGPLYLSEGQYMLIADVCPFCTAKEEAANTPIIPSDDNAVG